MRPNDRLAGSATAYLIETGKEPEQDHQPGVFLYAVENPSAVIADRDGPLSELFVVFRVGIARSRSRPGSK